MIVVSKSKYKQGMDVRKSANVIRHINIVRQAELIQNYTSYQHNNWAVDIRRLTVGTPNF